MTSTTIPPEVDLFDYDKVKKKYMMYMDSYIKQKQSHMVRTWDPTWIDSVISKLCKYERCLKSNGKNTIIKSKRYKVYKKYEVLRENGKNILIKRRFDYKTRVTQLLSYIDSFDVLVDAHRMTNHGDEQNMLLILQHYYGIFSTCYTNFVKACNVCSVRTDEVKEKNRKWKNQSKILKSQNKSKNNYTATVDILDMTHIPDGNINGILLYINKLTGYIFLKPLTCITDTSVVNDAAIELLNIFFDFGPPDNIQVKQHKLIFFKSILKQINSICKKCNIAIGRKKISEDTGNEYILQCLAQWNTERNSRNWSLLCHVLQWKVNTTCSALSDIHQEVVNQGSKHKTPYSAIFNHNLPDNHLNAEVEVVMDSVTIADSDEIISKDSNDDDML